MALAIAAFGIGTSEFIIMGLLPNLAQDLQVSIPKAGVLVTAYALARDASARRWLPSRPHASSANWRCCCFSASSPLATSPAQSRPTYPLLFAARVLTALSHGAFFGIGSVVASNWSRATSAPRRLRSCSPA